LSALGVDRFLMRDPFDGVEDVVVGRIPLAIAVSDLVAKEIFRDLEAPLTPRTHVRFPIFGSFEFAHAQRQPHVSPQKRWSP
jgi:hypothetical protein